MDLSDYKKTVYIPHTEYRLISAMYELVCDGVFYCMYKSYFDSIAESFNKKTPNHIWFIHTVNAYYDLAVSHWCKVFGSHSEPTHYYNLIETQSLVIKLLEVGIEAADTEHLKGFLLNGCNLKAEEYDTYHQLTKEYRDRNLVHREHSPDEINDGDLYFPKLDIAKDTFLSLALLLINLAKKFPEVGDEVNSYRFLYGDFSESLRYAR